MVPVLTAILGGATALVPLTVAGAGAGERDTILIGRKKVPYLSNRPLTYGDTNVTRAIIVIHGGDRILEEYYAPIVATIPAGPAPEEDWRRKTIVLAPYFQEKSDAARDKHGWKGNWREGGSSDGISSYAVVDTLVARLRNGAFPNLKWIVITGHSAGGQFVQRYAAFTDIDLKPEPNSACVKFVPANPSSYVYLNEYRHGRDNNWIIPTKDCSSGDGYDEWKYGLKNLHGYAAARGAEFARAHLPLRQIELLAGTADVMTGEGFDKDCAAMWQGSTRFERAQLFKAFMDHFFPTNHLSLTAVPGVGHSGPGMYASPEGRKALFFPD
jgi:hypothetical protein